MSDGCVGSGQRERAVPRLSRARAQLARTPPCRLSVRASLARKRAQARARCRRAPHAHSRHSHASRAARVAQAAALADVCGTAGTAPFRDCRPEPVGDALSAALSAADTLLDGLTGGLDLPEDDAAAMEEDAAADNAEEVRPASEGTPAVVACSGRCLLLLAGRRRLIRASCPPSFPQQAPTALAVTPVVSAPAPPSPPVARKVRARDAQKRIARARIMRIPPDCPR
jgi:hypothetical protein